MATIKGRTLLWVRIILLVIVAYIFVLYVKSKKAIEKSAPINYSLISQSQSYWRGTNYKIAIFYNQEKYNLSVSRATSDSIEAGVMPKLYYDSFSSSIVYEYHLSLMLRVLLALLILFSLTYLKTIKSAK